MHENPGSFQWESGGIWLIGNESGPALVVFRRPAVTVFVSSSLLVYG